MPQGETFIAIRTNHHDSKSYLSLYVEISSKQERTKYVSINCFNLKLSLVIETNQNWFNQLQFVCALQLFIKKFLLISSLDDGFRRPIVPTQKDGVVLQVSIKLNQIELFIIFNFFWFYQFENVIEFIAAEQPAEFFSIFDGTQL